MLLRPSLAAGSTSAVRLSSALNCRAVATGPRVYDDECMTDRVPAHTLSDDLLRHELLQLKNHEADIHSSGTADQQANHAARTTELEAEFSKRFPSTEAQPAAEPASEPQPGIFPGAGEGPPS